MYSFNHNSPEIQEFFESRLYLSGKPVFLPEPPVETTLYSLLLPNNPLDDGMADIQTMFSVGDSILTVEGQLENHNLETVHPATVFIFETEEHGRHFVCVSDEKLGMKWSLTFWKKLSTA